MRYRTFIPIQTGPPFTPAYEDGSFNKKTYPSSAIPNGKQLFSGTWPPKGDRVHGGYFDGLNQDSIVRPKWAQAQVSAIIGTERHGFSHNTQVGETK